MSESETERDDTHDAAGALESASESASENASGSASENATDNGSVWGRVLAFGRRHKSRLLRTGLLIGGLYAASDLLKFAPQDATLSLPVSELRRDAGPSDELAITVVGREGREPLTHTRTRLAPDQDELRHVVHLAPGRYVVLVELGTESREGHFEIPAEGVVRVRWAPP